MVKASWRDNLFEATALHLPDSNSLTSWLTHLMCLFWNHLTLEHNGIIFGKATTVLCVNNSISDLNEYLSHTHALTRRNERTNAQSHYKIRIVYHNSHFHCFVHTFKSNSCLFEHIYTLCVFFSGDFERWHNHMLCHHVNSASIISPTSIIAYDIFNTHMCGKFT